MTGGKLAAATAYIDRDRPATGHIIRIIEVVRDLYPDLSANGFLVGPQYRPDKFAEREAHHRASRADMTGPENVQQFRVAWKFLTADGGPLLTGTINKKCGTSYSWKHTAEEFTGGHCSNGVFIVAALAAGCAIERVAPDDPNAWFNLSSSMLPLRDHRTGRQIWRDRRAVRSRSMAG